MEEEKLHCTIVGNSYYDFLRTYFQCNQPRYCNRSSSKKSFTSRSRQTSTTSTVSNASLRSRLTVINDLGCTVSDKKDSKYLENDFKSNQPGPSCTDSIEDSLELEKEDEGMDVEDDKFDENIKSPIKQNKRRISKPKLR